tara:strand:- start:127 stop:279 length:153 start_codon:yes stop_codon:yes gene_type:complete
MDSKPLVREHENLIVSYWTQKTTNKEKPSELFKKYCDTEPWMPECKQYDV